MYLLNPSPQERPEFSEVISDRRGGDTGFADRVADLIKAEHDIAGGIEAGDRGALVGVDHDAPVRGGLRTEACRQLRVHDRAERGIKRLVDLAAGRAA